VHSYSDEDVAVVVHDAQVGLSKAQHSAPPTGWHLLTEVQRRAAVDSVRLARCGATPKGIHDAWREALLADGWRWGAVKDPVARIHPCLVPWERLSKAEQDKDILFIMVVTALTVGWHG
jgi:hypothetical protein